MPESLHDLDVRAGVFLRNLGIEVSRLLVDAWVELDVTALK